MTSTPRGLLHSPAPFPAMARASRSPHASGSHPVNLVEISSSDPKLAARAAAILKVHHGFIPRGCKVENDRLMNADELQYEMEKTILEEEGRYESSSQLNITEKRLGSVGEGVPSERQTPSEASCASLVSRSTGISHERLTSPNPIPDSPSKSRSKRPRMREPQERELYEPDFKEWTKRDWKSLEGVLWTTQRAWERDGNVGQVEPATVVQKMLKSLHTSVKETGQEWAWYV